VIERIGVPYGSRTRVAAVKEKRPIVIGGFNLEVQQNIVALRPIRGEMFIEHATSKRFFLAPAERNISRSPRTIGGNIALRWSASYRVSSTIYKHLAPLERKLIL
jgi:hypothetical protein